MRITLIDFSVLGANKITLTGLSTELIDHRVKKDRVTQSVVIKKNVAANVQTIYPAKEQN